jgi:hypothetical protein
LNPIQAHYQAVLQPVLKLGTIVFSDSWCKILLLRSDLPVVTELQDTNSMKSPRTFIALLAFTALAQASDFHVSPDGGDSNPGTVELPLATPEGAVAAVRRELVLKGDHPEPINVFFKGGVYRLSAPLKFTPADSGRAAAPVTYAAVPGEHVVISGGIPITGTWTQTPGKPYWEITLPKAKDGGWIFNSLTVNGLSRMRARFPKDGVKELRAEGIEPGGDPRHSLHYRQGDFDPSWTNPTDIDVVLLANWTPVIHRVREVLPGSRSIRFQGSDSHRVDAWDMRPRYYLSNVFEALTDPGEWYLNRKTGVLYYYPMPGEDLAKASVEVPVLKSRMIEFEGDLTADHPVEYLNFRDLHFRSVDGDLDRYDGQYRQGHMFLDAAIFAQGLRHASFESCEFSQLGQFAMELADGCRDITIRHCHFWDLGAGALQIGVSTLNGLKAVAPSGKPAPEVDPRREVLGITVDNNLIHRLGTIWHGCYGIVNRFASGTRITHNEIFDTHWDAVGLDARWDWKGEKYSHGNEVAYNHLHDLGLGYECDAGAVYQFGPLDTSIHHNLIHDTRSYPYNTGFTGVYLDEMSRGAVVENNLAYNLDWTAFLQHFGDDNVFRNNIGAFARDGFFKLGSSKTGETNYVEVTRNIYIGRDEKLQTLTWTPGPKPVAFDRNVYFSLDPKAQPTFAGKSFDEWKAAGRDSNSFIMNPGCRAPHTFDFSMTADSPACKAIGFVPFGEEIKKAGLAGDTAWTNAIKLPSPRKVLPAWTEDELGPLYQFDIDPNQLPDGMTPTVFSPGNPGVFAVTSQVAGMNGPKSIECESSLGFLQSKLIGFNKGRVTLSFAIMQPADHPASFSMEMRDGSTPYRVGPSLSLSREGVISAGKEKLGKLDPGKWARFEVSFSLGEGSPQNYSLKISDGSGETTRVIPFQKDGIHQIKNLAFLLPKKDGGKIYLDDMHLKIQQGK